MRNFWVIQYETNSLPMTKATLSRAGVDPFDDQKENLQQAALFENEADAQDAAAEYEYFVLGQGGNPAEIRLAEYNGLNILRTTEVI